MFDKTFQYIKKHLPDVTGGGKVSNKKSTALDKYGWYSTIVEVAKSGIIGNIEQVKFTNVWEFLTVLAVIRAEQKTMNQQNE